MVGTTRTSRWMALGVYVIVSNSHGFLCARARGAFLSLTRLQSLLRVVVTDEVDDLWLVSFLILFFFFDFFFFWY